MREWIEKEFYIQTLELKNKKNVSFRFVDKGWWEIYRSLINYTSLFVYG